LRGPRRRRNSAAEIRDPSSEKRFRFSSLRDLLRLFRRHRADRVGQMESRVRRRVPERILSEARWTQASASGTSSLISLHGALFGVLHSPPITPRAKVTGNSPTNGAVIKVTLRPSSRRDTLEYHRRYRACPNAPNVGIFSERSSRRPRIFPPRLINPPAIAGDYCPAEEMPA